MKTLLPFSHWLVLAAAVCLRAQLPPPTAPGTVNIEVSVGGDTRFVQHDYQPPKPYTILAQTVIRSLDAVSTSVFVPGAAGSVVSIFTFDENYSANHPEIRKRIRGVGLYFESVAYYRNATERTDWDEQGRPTFSVRGFTGRTGSLLAIEGRGRGQLFQSGAGPSAYPIPRFHVADVVRTEGKVPWFSLGRLGIGGTSYPLDYRYLTGAGNFWTETQPDGTVAVFHSAFYRLVGDELGEFYPIGSVATTGTAGQPPHFEVQKEPVTPEAALQKLKAADWSFTGEFVPTSPASAIYISGSNGATASKLQYKLQVQPGLARTITWSETFTPEGATEPTDYRFVSEEVAATASETRVHLLDPFQWLEGRSGRYEVVAFESESFDATLTADTNRDGTLVSAGGPITPYVIAHADTVSTEQPYVLAVNADDDDADGVLDRADAVVNGADDLADFVPVFLNIKQLLATLPPSANARYKLKQTDGALNFVYTDLVQAAAFNYLNNPGGGFGPAFDHPAAVAPVEAIMPDGVELSADFLNRIETLGQGVILIEATRPTQQPLVLSVETATGTAIVRLPLLAYEASIAVDANRDGEIKLANEDASDATSDTQPYRFWLNDDDDGDPTDENEVYPVTAKDCDDFAIHGRRDLEDIARLHVLIGGLSDVIVADNPSIYVGLKWKNTTGSPSINIFPAVETDGGTRYLTDTATATQQAPASTLRTTVLTKDNQYKRVDTNGTWVFNKDFWTGLSSGSPKKYLLFEGCTEGKGELVLVLLRPDGTEIGEGPGVWIDLKNIKSMYQRVKVTPRDPSGIPPPFLSGTTFDANGSGTEPSDDGYPFAAPADEAKTALVFVHGSNIPYEEARWNAETMLKRLWWQGYKGRFVLFYWDTLIGPWDGTIPAHYNLNEYRALKYGWALKNYVESALPSDYAHNVVGHSMGNAVITSALRAREAVNGSTIPGMAARNVVFMQAAMPASCFDSGAATLAELAALESPQTTPDGVGQMGYRGVIETGVNATLFNIYNENDYALGWWVTNQRLMKPEDLLYRGYARKYTWTTTGGGQLWDWSNIEAGPIRMRYLEDLSESMSFVARSRTAALGRMNVGGSISNNLNISEGTELDFGRDRPDHSGEFTRRIQQLGPFYRYLFERAR